MTKANDFWVGDKVIRDGEYYDDGIETEHTIVEICSIHRRMSSGVSFWVSPMPDTCAVDGLEGWIDSGWFTRAV